MQSKLLQILERKKKQIRQKHNSPDGCAESAQEFELYLKLAKANIPPKYWDYSIKDLDRANTHVKAKLEKYCGEFENALNKGLGLFLVGSNGTGKTLSACLILREAIRKGYSARLLC